MPEYPEIDKTQVAVELAELDQIEASLKDGDESVEARAAEIIANIAEAENGLLFLFCGVKAMLKWMVSEDEQC